MIFQFIYHQLGRFFSRETGSTAARSTRLNRQGGASFGRRFGEAGRYAPMAVWPFFVCLLIILFFEGGIWMLEPQSGLAEPIVVTSRADSGLAETIVVTSAADSGAGTLRHRSQK